MWDADRADACTRWVWPDQWPAVTDQWAAPVEGDDETVEVLRPVLKQTMVRPPSPIAQRRRWTLSER